MNRDMQPAWAFSQVFIPGVKPRKRRIGRIVYVVANVRCRICGEAFAPFADLWAGDRTCVFCHDDAVRKAGAA